MAVVALSKRLVKDGMSSTSNKHKVTWKVKCDSVTDTTWTVYVHAVNPKKGSAVPAEVGTLSADYVALDDGDVQPMGDSPLWFTITVEYGVPSVNITGFDNPLNVVQRYGGGSDIFRTVYRDIDGLPLTNWFGDRIDPLPEAPCNAGSFGLVIRRTELGEFPSISHHVNSAAIWGLPARTTKIGRVSWRSGSEGGVKFWEIDIPFDYNKDTWDLVYESVGWRGYKAGAALTSDNIVDATDPNTGRPSQLPMYMDEDGQFRTIPIPAGTYPDPIKRKLFTTYNFASLGLPNPFTLT